MNSSQIDLGAATPRLHLWNSDIVSCLTNLDSQCSFPPSFGRLPVKDISLTPFAAMTTSYCEVKSQLSDAHHSHAQFHVSKLKDSTKRRLCDFSNSIHVAVSEAVKPIIYSNASEYVKIIHEDNLSDQNEIIPDANQSHVAPGTISESDDDDETETTAPMSIQFDQFCQSALVFVEPIFHQAVDETFATVLNQLEALSLPEITSEFDSNPTRDFAYLFDLIAPKCSHPVIPNLQSGTSLSNLDVASICLDSSTTTKLEHFADTTFLHSVQMKPASGNISTSLQFSGQPFLKQGMSLNERIHHIVPNNTFQSTSDRAYSSDPSISFELITSSFKLDSASPDCVQPTVSLSPLVANVISSPVCGQMQGPDPFFSSTSSEVHHQADQSDDVSGGMLTPDPFLSQVHHQTNQASDLHKFSIDSTLAQEYEQCALEAEYDQQYKLANHLASGFIKCTEMINHEPVSVPKKVIPEAQVIFSTEAQKIFYDKFTSQIPSHLPSQHIFQVDNVWIDSRTLALSMRSGCWFNSYAMFAFCKMFNSQQEEKLKLRNRNPGEIVYFYMDKKISEVLCTNNLYHNDLRYLFHQNSLGVRLECADHVFIPCELNHQWFVIVANFNKKSFDVLSSDYRIDNYLQLVNTVIYNFKCLFMTSFPTFKQFNIRDFEPSYLQVPKQTFKYDSGIFALQFMQTYDGSTVQKFSNADLLALRQRFLFQLLSYKCNKFVSKFVDMLL